MDTKDLENHLKTENPNIIQVGLIPSKNKEKFSKSYLVTIKGKEDINNIKAINHINNAQITWQRYVKPRKHPMCHRCQNFGHGSGNCNNPPRYVKCPKNHLTKDCKKLEGIKSTCCNCSGTTARTRNAQPTRTT